MTELRRELDLLDATCVVVGAVVGVGIFFTPARVALLAGSSQLALLAWGIAGGIAVLGALTFAEIGGMYPRSGAQYTALRDAYGPLVAFLFVFCNATAIQAGAIAIIAILCTQNLGIALTGEAPAGIAVLGVSVLLILALVTANRAGVQWGSRLQNATVVAKMAALLAITGLALVAAPDAADTRGVDPVSNDTWRTGLYAALVPCLFSFGGWQHGLWIGGEIRDAHRNVPRAILLGVLAVVVIYLLVNWAYLELLGHAGVSRSAAVAADAVAAVHPGTATRAVALAVAVSAFGVLNAQLLSGPRLIFAMSRDGRFGRRFQALNARGAPAPAILLLGSLAILLLMVAYAAASDPIGAVDQLLTGVVFVDGLFFILTGAALLVLRRRRPTAKRPVRVPLFPAVPILFVVGEGAVVTGAYLDPDMRASLLIGIAWIAAAAVLYAWRFRKQALPDEA